jgi:hypothetical protein
MYCLCISLLLPNQWAYTPQIFVGEPSITCIRVFAFLKKNRKLVLKVFSVNFVWIFFSESYYFENNYVKTRSVASSEYCKFIDVERFGDFHFDIFRSRLLYAAVEFFDT